MLPRLNDNALTGYSQLNNTMAGQAVVKHLEDELKRTTDGLMAANEVETMYRLQGRSLFIQQILDTVTNSAAALKKRGSV